jgi:phosphate-selective porin OprO/OprP
MKKFMAVAVVVGGILHSPVAFATTLEDVLMEKGVISQEDYLKVTQTQSQPIAYKLGDGFTFTSADAKYQGSIGGFMQLRYAFTDLDTINDTKTKSVQNSSAFSMNRVKLFFNGYSLTPDLTYKLQLNITKGNVLSTGQMIEEAYINYRFIDEAQIRFGQDKVPFARQFIVSSANQQFIDLSHVATAFAPGYDNGVTLNGKIAKGLVNYNVGVFGGVGQGTVDATNDNAIVARLAINPLGDMKYTESDIDYTEKPLVSVGANYYGDTIKNGATTNLNIFSTTGWIGIGAPIMPKASAFAATEKLNINTTGYDVAFKWRGLYAQSEYFLGQAEGQSTYHTLRAQG